MSDDERRERFFQAAYQRAVEIGSTPDTIVLLVGADGSGQLVMQANADSLIVALALADAAAQALVTANAELSAEREVLSAQSTAPAAMH